LRIDLDPEGGFSSEERFPTGIFEVQDQIVVDGHRLLPITNFKVKKPWDKDDGSTSWLNKSEVIYTPGKPEDDAVRSPEETHAGDDSTMNSTTQRPASTAADDKIAAESKRRHPTYETSPRGRYEPYFR
jgi:hypothetical protein